MLGFLEYVHQPSVSVHVCTAVPFVSLVQSPGIRPEFLYLSADFRPCVEQQSLRTFEIFEQLFDARGVAPSRSKQTQYDLLPAQHPFAFGNSHVCFDQLI